MTRRQIMAEVLAHLEAERFAPSPRPDDPEPIGWTPEEQATHRATLEDTLSDDPVVVAWAERGAA